MATRERRQYPSLRHGAPDRGDMLAVIAVTLALGLELGALFWIWGAGGLSGLGAIVGVAVGILMVISWSLRDGLLGGEPRFQLARRISLSFLTAGFVLATALWVGRPEAASTGMVVASMVFSAWLLFVFEETGRVNREVQSPVVTVGQGAGGRALIVYHSARGGLMRAMQEAFADGLQAQGWQVALSTASRFSPVDLSGYELLVLGTPCYNRGMARPISSYLSRVGELPGMPVVIVVTGFNYTERAVTALRDRVYDAHGTVVDEIELWTGRPNVVRDGATESAEIMRREGSRLGNALRTAAA